MKNLHFITCQPSDKVFASQIAVQLANFRELEYSDKARCLIFVPEDRVGQELDTLWQKVMEEFTEVKFFIYEDKDNVLKDIRQFNYIPLLRPYMLQKHLVEYPELEKDVLFYLDSDVLFTKKLDFLPEFMENEICYVSDAKSYMNSEYFDSKIKDTRPDKTEQYKNVDVLELVANICGIDRKTCEKFKNSTGGVQYIFKGVNAHFFKKVYYRCCLLREFFTKINQEFFPSEDAGFQGWCADLWAIQFSLWEQKIETQTPAEMNFAWATDPIKRWEDYYIYHDAGAGGPMTVNGKIHQLFNKRSHQYVNNIITYFEDDLSFVSPDYCSKKYVEWINFTKDKYIWK